MTLPLFTLTGSIGSVIGGSQVPSSGMALILRSNVDPGDLIGIDGVADFVGTVAVMLDNSGKINGGNGISLLANDDVLGLSTPVQWTVSSAGAAGSPEINSWTFDAPNIGETLDLLATVPVPGMTATGITRGPKGDKGNSGPRIARNTIAAVGDSMTARNSFGQESIIDTAGGNMAPPVAPQSYINPTYLRLLPILTHQRIREGAGMYAVSNSWVTHEASVQLPYVLAMNPLPGACVLCCNNAEILGNNTSYSFSANQGLIKSMVAQLLAVGVVPILWTIPPINSTIQIVDVATINVRLNQWNVWIRRYAAEQGFPLIDAHTALTQVDGTHIPGTVVNDVLHPNGTGNVLIAQQAIADGLADWFPPNSLVNTARTTDDLTNLFNDGTTNLGLFTSNTSGVGTGLTATGTATFSVVAPASTDELLGNWQQITVAAANNAYAQATLTGWSVGDTLAYSCRVQTENMANSNAVYSLGLISDAAQPYNGAARWGDFNTQAPDIDDGELYFELEIPSGITSLKHRIWIQSVASGSATLRAGEVTIRNLTTGGFLV